MKKALFLETVFGASPAGECSLGSCLPPPEAHSTGCDLCELRDCVLSIVEPGAGGCSGRAWEVTPEQPTGAELGSGVAFKVSDSAGPATDPSSAPPACLPVL